MKYPKFNNKPLDEINQKKFNKSYRIIQKSINFDNDENKLGLSKKDIQLLSYNLAFLILFK